MPEADQVVNRTLLLDNGCFGCGHVNPAGLHIEIFQDNDAPLTLRGRFQPSEDMVGFPGISHGGVIFTALDCLSTWVATLLRPNPEAAWVLRSANVVYQKPALAGEAIALVGWIEGQGGTWDPITVRTEALRGDGVVCVEGEFKVVPLSAEKLAEIAGIATLPKNWQAFLSKDRTYTPACENRVVRLE